MTWETFKEKASKINSRWFFKRSQRGFEVWEKAYISGDGFPSVYPIQVIPKQTIPLQWICYLRTLQSMDLVRKNNQQTQKLAEMNSHNDRVKQKQKDDLMQRAGMLASQTREEMKREADRLNISEHAIRNRMEGVRWDDTKKVLKKMREEKAGLK